MRLISETPLPLPALRVATICTGNICRSPMAEVWLRHLVDTDPSLRGRVEVTSAGTARWHVGASMDPRARDALDRAALPGAGSPAAYAGPEFLARQALVLVMTREHREDVLARAPDRAGDVVLWRNLIAPACELDVPDPYYGTDQAFDDCLSLISSAGPVVTWELRRRLDARSPAG